MAAPQRVGPKDVWDRVHAGSDLLLVCAYDDDAKCRANHLKGATTFNEFRSRADSLPRDQELVFYCA